MIPLSCLERTPEAAYSLKKTAASFRTSSSDPQGMSLEAIHQQRSLTTARSHEKPSTPVRNAALDPVTQRLEHASWKLKLTDLERS